MISNNPLKHSSGGNCNIDIGTSSKVQHSIGVSSIFPSTKC